MEVGLDYIAGMFTFLFLFYLIAIFIMICENIHFYFKRIRDMKEKDKLTG